MLLAAASGVALALSFPNYNLSILSWFAVTMLVLAAYHARTAMALLAGFVQGVLFYVIGVPWIDTVMRQYGNVGALTAAGLLGLLAVAGGIIVAFFTWAVALASRRSTVLACVLAPFLWVTLEFARSHLPIIAFPWNLAGYAASGNLAFVQLTTVTGIYGLSFVIVGYGSLLAYAILIGRRAPHAPVRHGPPYGSTSKRSQRAWQRAFTASLILIVVGVVGRYLVPREEPDHTAHLVQTNFPQSEEYPADWGVIHAGELDELERISVDAAITTPGIIVWPEVPAPFSLQDSAFAARARRIAADSAADFLVGVVDWKQGMGGKWEASNSAVLLSPSGRRLFTYDKIRLVPFGEYVPLRRWLTFAGKLTADIGDFTPGAEYSVGQLPDGTFAVFICYEAVFPDEVRQFTLNGAELLINVSNDGWFGRSGAPSQHLMMARVRAVENRRWLLRDTNNGYTVSVDPYGRIAAELAPDIRGQLDAPYAFRDDLTFYAIHGDWFAWLCVIVSVVLLAIAILGRNRGDSPGPRASKAPVP